ncbi:uncharacterized protein LOC100900437 [Galendromus occidentalis]|uniref:Uncharacterized protein LOC100900437 n=1 Tax=Galendromus occidentalis TaxID=34638 RepID=A0AAJ6QPK7_9ACAR|nr:uncharacterized protein LOC100900437 [Galendromus occidentalis]
MKFLAQVTSCEEKEDLILVSMLNPRFIRGTQLGFKLSKVQKIMDQHLWFPRITSLFTGELKDDEELTKVEFLQEQQFRGVIRDWSPINMRATVEYPDIAESHSQNFRSPWLAKGDRIIVKGNVLGSDWSVGDFRLHRRVQTCKLETGVITNLSAYCGELKSSFHEDIEFEYQDVLLYDCRDFFPEGLKELGYVIDLEETFRKGERVFFIRAQDPDLERDSVKVFAPKTHFGHLDPIFKPPFSDIRHASTGNPDFVNNHECPAQIPFEDASFPCGFRSESRGNIRCSPIATSCPDINARCNR